MNQSWIPEIMYEESEDGISTHIPFIMVPQGQVMPKMLFIFESRDTGEYEPNLQGDPVPIVEMDLHQYADMAVLKNNMTPVEYDNVRFALGLESLIFASKKGSEISQKIRNKVESKES